MISFRACSFLVLATAAYGCASDDAPSDTADAGQLEDAAAAVPIVTVFRGVYFVPERSDVSTYEIDEAKWIVTGSHVRLEYALPRMLVGRSERVQIEGELLADGSASLAGRNGTGDCQLNPSSGVLLSCFERFSSIEVDLEGVRDEAERNDPSRVSDRTSIAVQFSTEPIGVFEATAEIAAGAADDE